ncbi:MAG: hypothetical protein K0Q46_5351 [Rhodococcus erythropolis]|jgi:hypothetical protein|nr:hypothetical protein [Rhodococcus erythropolis]
MLLPAHLRRSVPVNFSPKESIPNTAQAVAGNSGHLPTSMEDDGLSGG